MNYKLVVSYNGTNFHGWAIQKNINTIQGTLQDVLYDLFKLKIVVNASGRTDAYVHAIAQVINLQDKNLNIKPKALKEALNAKLGHDIRIISCQVVDNHFHARYSAFKKTYEYNINIGSYNCFEHNLIYQYNKPIDIKRIKKIIPFFIGEHDFLSFSTSQLADTKRIVEKITINKKENIVKISITANGFLRNMVRMIVGCIIAYNENKINEQTIIDCFQEPKKGKIIYKMPGCGLYLKKVYYK